MIPAVMPVYARADVAFDHGAGMELVDSQGARYLDFAAGIAVNALGHAHPRLVAALQAQAERVWHVANLYRIPEQERLAERLVAATFADTAFFCNSGTEAVETAIKVARKHHAHRGQDQRWRVITCAGGFHGRSLTAIAAAGQDKMLAGFGPAVPGFDQVPFNDAAAVEAAITDETAAILVEPIQGEGGVRPADLAYLRALRAIADRHGLILIFDEIQTGVGRTGRLFAHEHAGIAPDVMAVAKGLGAGFPIGACLATEDAAKGMTAGSHGATFGGNPLACAVGNAVLDEILADGFLPAVAATGERLWAATTELAASYPAVFQQARGAGLMQGLVARPAASAIIAGARRRGLLVVPAGENTVRLLPPLICSAADVDRAYAILEATAAELADAEAAEGTA